MTRVEIPLTPVEVANLMRLDSELQRAGEAWQESKALADARARALKSLQDRSHAVIEAIAKKRKVKVADDTAWRYEERDDALLLVTDVPEDGLNMEVPPEADDGGE